VKAARSPAKERNPAAEHMRMRTFVRFAFSIGAVALFAGCGGASPPIATPVAGAQSLRADGIPHHPASSSSYQVLYRFDRYPNGSYPLAGLVDVNGTLYGTARQGGKGCHKRSYGCGTVFSITPSGAEHLVYAFDPWASGAYPYSGLTAANGTFYGTTYQGGNGSGTVYSLSNSGVETVLHAFQGQSDGGFPEGPLLDANGTLYGTTSNGGVKTGRYYHGTVYSISASGVHTVLHKFKGAADGSYPDHGLIDVNGTLYGTTPYGGKSTACAANGCGTVYSITPSGTEKVLHSFTGGSDGEGPRGELVDVNGTMYGTTSHGGSGTACNGGCGTVFSVTTSGQEKVLYSFAGGSDGEVPLAGLIDVNGTLYGTTAQGGSGSCSSGCGTVFSVTTAGAETVLYAFASITDGWYPEAPLTDVSGTFYGTTEEGGNKQWCCGTIFALTP
jgi:uncharacterized repeat protein (TIGR03803 family)